MKCYRDIFTQIVSVENLFAAWDEFRVGKMSKYDVQVFARTIETRLFELHRDLAVRKYRHAAYSAFRITDPKQRLIHKAVVRDRIVHHALFSVLNPIFEPTFIAHSFSCRVGKGTHKGVTVVEQILRSVSCNNTRPCFVLKCDISKFFASVDHSVLLRVVERRVRDERALELVREIISSFYSDFSNTFDCKGLPLGNLTSQLFANIYMNEFDQFVKHKLHIQHYARYTDDFVIVSSDRLYLENLIPELQDFLTKKLGLQLHPHKTIIRKYSQGVDFLGYILFPYHRLVRSTTKRRMLARFSERVDEYANGTISETQLRQVASSYLGVLSHAHTHTLSEKIKNDLWLGI